MRIAYAAGKDWRKELNKFLMVYRITPHTTTGASPAKLLFGREIRTKVPCLKRESQINVDVAVKDALLKEKGKIYDSPQAADRQIETADIVLVKNAKRKTSCHQCLKMLCIK
jgi:hypothetical protein